MSRTTFSGPVFSNNGFGSPISYVTAADNGTTVDINPGTQVVILSQADGGPATVTLRLPKVFTSDGEVFTINNAGPTYAGVIGYILNYGGDDHTLIGTDSQPVNESATGVKIAKQTAVQYAGNGNPDAPWAAVQMDLCATV